MPRRIFLLYMLCVALGSFGQDSSFANELPAEAQRVINSLPDKSLTVPMILVLGTKNAESFKQVVGEKALIPAAKLQSEAPFATQVFASAQNSDDRREPASSFAYRETLSQTYQIGARKYLPTGTLLSLAYSHQNLDQNRPSSSLLSNSAYYDSELQVSVEQNLLKDAFGGSSRQLRAAGALASEAQGHRSQVVFNQWVLGMTNLFYQAWLSQKTLEIATDSLERKEQLLKATRLKSRRGTAEKPDLLQVESAHLLAETQKHDAAQELYNYWRQLILSLKLPADWVEVDPIHIPVTLDDPQIKAKAQCDQFRERGVPREESPEVRLALAEKESSQLSAEGLKGNISPDLKFFANLYFNGIETGIDRQASESLNEALSTDNPAWVVGLKLNWPLDFQKEKSEYIQNYAKQIRAEGQYLGKKDDLRIDWMNLCSSMDRLAENVQRAKVSFQKQRAREKLESRRFRLGRIPVFNFIQAGDDAASAERIYYQQLVALRQTSWQILSQSSQVADIVEAFRPRYEPSKE